MKQFSFEKLDAYRESKLLVVKVYDIIKIFPQYEQYALSSQLRRSITSVPFNIAEGTGRLSYKDKIRFLEIAFGSLMEAYCQLDVAKSLGYIDEDLLHVMKPKFYTVSRLINGLQKSYERLITQSLEKKGDL